MKYIKAFEAKRKSLYVPEWSEDKIQVIFKKECGDKFYEMIAKELGMIYYDGDGDKEVFFTTPKGETQKFIQLLETEYGKFIDWVEVVDNKFIDRTEAIEQFIWTFRNTLEAFEELSDQEYIETIDDLKNLLEKLKKIDGKTNIESLGWIAKTTKQEIKYIKNYEQYEFKQDEQLNEGLVKTILMFPITLLQTILGLTIIQFAPKVYKAAILRDIMDVYANLDTLKKSLTHLIDGTKDITDTERKKIEKGIKELDKIKRKYPTLMDYKRKTCRIYGNLTIKNREYIKNSIMDYEPKEMDSEQIEKKLKKIYKHFQGNDGAISIKQYRKYHNQVRDPRLGIGNNRIKNMKVKRFNENILGDSDDSILRIKGQGINIWYNNEEDRIYFVDFSNNTRSVVVEHGSKYFDKLAKFFTVDKDPESVLEDLRTEEISDEELMRLISGGLKECVNAHGPVTRELIPSAVKRISGQIKGYINEYQKMKKQSVNDNFVVIEKSKYDKMIKDLDRKHKTINDLLQKLGLK